MAVEYEKYGVFAAIAGVIITAIALYYQTHQKTAPVNVSVTATQPPAVPPKPHIQTVVAT